MIKAWNNAEQLSQEEVHQWLDEIDTFFKWLRTTQPKFMAAIKDNVFTPEMKASEYTKALKVYKVLLNKRSDPDKVRLLKQMLEDNGGQLLDVFIQRLPSMEAEACNAELEDACGDLLMAAEPAIDLR